MKDNNSEEIKIFSLSNLSNFLTILLIINGALIFYFNYQDALKYEKYYKVPYHYFLGYNILENKFLVFVYVLIIMFTLTFLIKNGYNQIESSKNIESTQTIVIILISALIFISLFYLFRNKYLKIWHKVLIIFIPILLMCYSTKKIRFKNIIFIFLTLLLIINLINLINLNKNFKPKDIMDYEILRLKKDNNKEKKYLVKISEKDGNFVVIDGKICKDNKTLKLKKGSYKLVDPTEFTITYKKFNKVDSLNQEDFNKIK